MTPDARGRPRRLEGPRQSRRRGNSGTPPRRGIPHFAGPPGSARRPSALRRPSAGRSLRREAATFRSAEPRGCFRPRRRRGSASDTRGARMPVTDAPAKARALYDARRTRVPIPPFTDADPSLGMADGYAMQQELIDLLLADGDRIIGHKVGADSASRCRRWSASTPPTTARCSPPPSTATATRSPRPLHRAQDRGRDRVRARRAAAGPRRHVTGVAPAIAGAPRGHGDRRLAHRRLADQARRHRRRPRLERRGGHVRAASCRSPGWTPGSSG